MRQIWQVCSGTPPLRIGGSDLYHAIRKQGSFPPQLNTPARSPSVNTSASEGSVELAITEVAGKEKLELFFSRYTTKKIHQVHYTTCELK